MKYMNKQLAEQTAENMLKSAQAKIDEKVTQQKIFAESLVWKTVPEKDRLVILRLVSEGWINTNDGFRFKNPLVENDYSSCYFNTITQVPAMRNNGQVIRPTRDEWEKLIEYSNEIKDMKAKKKALEQQIIATLLKLRTSERIQKDFPEAFKCLPKDAMGTKNEITFPIENILADISKFPG